MADLAILTPTRGRAARFAEMVKSVFATAAMDVQVWVGLDDDDPEDYYSALRALPVGDQEIVPMRGERLSLSGWTNLLAERALSVTNPPRFLASLGDDHRPRTTGWDERLVAAIEEMGGSGIAYGNDLFQGRGLPTAWVMSADIVAALGWMMLPACRHMYVDNAILALGRELGLIAYRPDVVIEHLHPLAGKAAMDESYRASNRPALVAVDGRAFSAWTAADDGLRADAARVRAALHSVRAG